MGMSPERGGAHRPGLLLIQWGWTLQGRPRGQVLALLGWQCDTSKTCVLPHFASPSCQRCATTKKGAKFNCNCSLLDITIYYNREMIGFSILMLIDIAFQCYCVFIIFMENSSWSLMSSLFILKAQISVFPDKAWAPLTQPSCYL